MKKEKITMKVLLLLLGVAIMAFILGGCNTSDESTTVDHPTAEHPAEEEATPEPPAELPEMEPPQSEHSTEQPSP